MRRITFCLKLFQAGVPSAEAEEIRSRAALLRAFEALAGINTTYLLTYKAPPLYQSGVVYVPEPPGREHWQDVPTTLERGKGDCEDLASWRIAELRVKGERAIPWVTWRRVGDGLRFHALVKRADGTIEDPSARLGMYEWSEYLART
jgi:hypothetical protein